MGNLKVSSLQLSSVVGRSRFRSGRFGGGRAAGELVLDCQSCPVYHLDGLIVQQSQLSSLENCEDLHSKEPLPLEHQNQTLGVTFTVFFYYILCHIYSIYVCGSVSVYVWRGYSHLDTDTNRTWQSGRRVSNNHLFGNKFSIHYELQKIFTSSNSFPLSHENSLTDFLLTFSPSASAQSCRMSWLFPQSHPSSHNFHAQKQPFTPQQHLIGTDWWRLNT